MSTPAPAFDAEQARLAAAAHLRPEHFVEFQRLAKSLIHGPEFQLLIIDCRDERLRAKVLQALTQVEQQAGLCGVEMALNADLSDMQALESRLVELAAQHQVIHILGASHWMSAERWDSFNLLRERLSVAARVRLVFWLNSEAITLVARHASDIWAWRAGIYRFKDEVPSVEEVASGGRDVAFTSVDHIDDRSMKDRYQRLAELRALVVSDDLHINNLLLPLLEEYGLLLFSLGEFNELIFVVNEKMLPLAVEAGDSRMVVLAWDLLADAYRSVGRYAEALGILRQKALPFHEKAKSEFDVAITMGRIADVLQDQGDLSGALDIRVNKQLPIYRKIGYARGAAIINSKNAAIYRWQGNPEGALKIWRDEVLPVFDELGDLRSRAVTLAKISDALQDLGEFDEALRIKRDDVLPVYEKLGAMRELIVGRINLAVGLILRGLPSDRDEIAEILVRAFVAAKKLGLPEAADAENIYKEFFGKSISLAE